MLLWGDPDLKSALEELMDDRFSRISAANFADFRPPVAPSSGGGRGAEALAVVDGFELDLGSA